MSNAWAAASDVAIRSLPGALTPCSRRPAATSGASLLRRRRRPVRPDPPRARRPCAVRPGRRASPCRRRRATETSLEIEPQRRVTSTSFSISPLISVSERANARTRSARVTMPTSLPCSTTGRRFTRSSEHQRGRGAQRPVRADRERAGSSSRRRRRRGLELQLAVDPVAVEHPAEPGLCAAVGPRSLNSRSASEITPSTTPSATTGIGRSIPCSTSSRAASLRDAPGSTVITSFVMTSRTFDALHLLLVTSP